MSCLWELVFFNTEMGIVRVQGESIYRLRKSSSGPVRMNGTGLPNGGRIAKLQRRLPRPPAERGAAALSRGILDNLLGEVEERK